MPLRRYADFRGRSGRPEFWWWTLFYYIVTIFLLVIMFAGFPWGYVFDASTDPGTKVPVGDGPFDIVGPAFWIGIGLYLIFFLGTIVPNLAVTVRRLHDRGMSGWWYGGLLIINFIPIINTFAFFGYIALLIVCILPGGAGPNRWGPDPRDPSQASVFE